MRKIRLTCISADEAAPMLGFKNGRNVLLMCESGILTTIKTKVDQKQRTFVALDDRFKRVLERRRKEGRISPEKVKAPHELSKKKSVQLTRMQAEDFLQKNFRVSEEQIDGAMSGMKPTGKHHNIYDTFSAASIMTYAKKQGWKFKPLHK